MVSPIVWTFLFERIRFNSSAISTFVTPSQNLSMTYRSMRRLNFVLAQCPEASR